MTEVDVIFTNNQQNPGIITYVVQQPVYSKKVFSNEDFSHRRPIALINRRLCSSFGRDQHYNSDFNSLAGTIPAEVQSC